MYSAKDLIENRKSESALHPYVFLDTETPLEKQRRVEEKTPRNILRAIAGLLATGVILLTRSVMAHLAPESETASGTSGHSGQSRHSASISQTTADALSPELSESQAKQALAAWDEDFIEDELAEAEPVLKGGGSSFSRQPRFDEDGHKARPHQLEEEQFTATNVVPIRGRTAVRPSSSQNHPEEVHARQSAALLSGDSFDFSNFKPTDNTDDEVVDRVDSSADDVGQDEDDDRERSRANRAPTTDGPVTLGPILKNGSMVLTTGLLLQNAIDPDGDALAIESLQVNSGSLVRHENATWQFNPDPDMLGKVTFEYTVSDGESDVPQSASLQIVEVPFQQIEGADAADVVVGSSGSDIIDARGGDDVVHGNDGDDLIMAGPGDDVVTGGKGNDVIFGGDGNDQIFGGDGNDTLFGEGGNDHLFGGQGIDVIWGGSGNDVIFAGSEGDLAFGGDGSDLIFGEEGNDVLDGGSGDDQLFGGDGDDIFVVEAPHFAPGNSNDASGGDSAPATSSDSNRDLAVMTPSRENDGSDLIDGGSGRDVYDISDTIADAVIDLDQGFAKSDDIGFDNLNSIENVVGGSGNDKIIFGAGQNSVWGGEGDDIFVFKSIAPDAIGESIRDIIEDFHVGDRIDISHLKLEIENVDEEGSDFESPESDAGDGFVFKMSGGFFDDANQLRYRFEVGDDELEMTVLEGNVNDDFDPDFEIGVRGHYEFSSHDFIGIHA